VCLLKRARWFEEHLRFVDRGAASLVEESRLADSMAWQVRRGRLGGLAGCAWVWCNVLACGWVTLWLVCIN